MSQELPFSPADYTITAEGLFAVARVRPDLPPCSRCDGSGRATQIIDGVVTVGRCRCRMLHDRVELFNRASIPARHGSSTLRSFKRKSPDQERAYDAVKSWLRAYKPGQHNRGLLLFGEVGRGKTHLLVAALRELILRHGVQARFVEFTHLLSELREGYDQGRSEEALIGSLVQVEALAIDDLGQGRRTDWEISILDSLITRRYNLMRTLIATSNYAPGPSDGLSEQNLASPRKLKLVDRVGERSYSRLNELCSFVPVTGEDYRIVNSRLAPQDDGG